jgi:hypothetical protein
MNIPAQVNETVKKSATKKSPATFEPRVRGKNEAGPRTTNLMTGTWVPHSMEPMRASANNHLSIKSLKP